jgi:hypothetical protein
MVGRWRGCQAGRGRHRGTFQVRVQNVEVPASGLCFGAPARNRNRARNGRRSVPDAKLAAKAVDGVIERGGRLERLRPVLPAGVAGGRQPCGATGGSARRPRAVAPGGRVGAGLAPGPRQRGGAVRRARRRLLAGRALGIVHAGMARHLAHAPKACCGAPDATTRPLPPSAGSRTIFDGDPFEAWPDPDAQTKPGGQGCAS